MGRVCVDEVTNMSLPRLLNSRMLELRRQLVASSSSSNTTRDPPPLHLSRNLFGTVDLQHNLKFAQQEMDKIHQADSKRWNFDFLAEKPKDGDYKWQKVDENTPQTCNIPRLTCRTPRTTTTTSSSTSTDSTFTSTHTTSRRNNKGVKRLHKKPSGKVTQKLCTDFFKQVKVSKNPCVSNEQKDAGAEVTANTQSVSIKLSDVLKIRSLNVR
ncbi:cyclin-dependent kinase inhibitor 1B-like [Homarus americanus]|uniref:Cyclin-dependent kinase inhibitor 1B-like n=1 Tax=Homarus americanus TaxID=6706 RepID=A0A8J5JQN4_HOMAM|nr:cyclin-dependent kinase inhibitor 1B-like [Homarus americanus]